MHSNGRRHPPNHKFNPRVPSDRRSWFVVRAFFFFLLTLAGLAVGCVLALHVPWVQRKAVDYGVRWVHNHWGFTISVEKILWNPFQGVRLEDVSAETDGVRSLETKAVTFRYRLSFQSPYLYPKELILTEPKIRLERMPNGTWRFPLLSAVEAKRTQKQKSSPKTLWSFPVLKIVSGRIQGYENGRKVLEVEKISGTFRLEGMEKNGQPDLRFLLEQWTGNLVVPSKGAFSFDLEGFWNEDRLLIQTARLRVEKAADLTFAGVWRDVPRGEMDFNLSWEELSVRRWSPSRVPKWMETGPLDGKARISGTLQDMTLSYETTLFQGSASGVVRFSRKTEGFKTTAYLKFDRPHFVLPGGAPCRFSGEISLKAAWTPGGASSGKLNGILEDVSIGPVFLKKAEVDAEFADNVFLFKTLHLIFQKGRLDAAGSMSLGKSGTEKIFLHEFAPELDIQLSLQNVDAKPWALLFHRKAVSGVVSADGRISGKWPEIQWQGTVTARKLQIDSFRAEEGVLEATGPVTGRSGPRRMNARFSSFAFREIKGRSLTLECKQEEDNRVSFRLQGEELLGTQRFQIRGRLEGLWDLQRVFQIDAGNVTLNGDRFLVLGRVIWSRDRWMVPKLGIQHGSEKLVLSGHGGKTGTVELEVRAQDLDMDYWAKRWLKRSGIKGKASGRMLVTGSLAKPVFNYHFVVHGGKVSEISLRTVEMRGRYADGRMGIDALVPFATESAFIKVRGEWPIRISVKPPSVLFPNTQKGRIDVELHRVPLTWTPKLIHQLRRATGILSGHVEITGTTSSPTIRGIGTVQKASFTLKSWSEPFQDLEGRWVLDDDRLHVQEARFRLLGGTVATHGDIFHHRGKLTGYVLRARGTGIHFPELFGIEGVGDAQVVCVQEGKVFSPEVKGTIRLSDARMSLGELGSDIVRNIHVVGEDQQGPVIRLGTLREKKKKHSAFHRLALDLAILLPEEGTWVRGYGLKARIQGSTTIKKAKGGPVRLYGTLRAFEGEYQFQGVRMELAEGSLTFRGLPRPDPMLNVVCEKELKDVQITATLTGPFSKPVLTLSSTPSMDRVDIISYLLYGRPADALSTQQVAGLQDRGMQLMGPSTTLMLRNLLGDLPLQPDVLEFKGTANGNVVEIGKYITPELFVTVRKGIGGEEEDLLKAEYRLNRHISVESSLGNENESGVDVFFRYDFGD